LVIDWKHRKSSNSIREGLEAAGINVTVKKPNEAKDIDYFDYDLVCVGSPSIQWHPAKPMDDFLKKRLESYRKQGKIKPSAPKISGKNALIFVTYSGPHTGLDEATPVGKYMRQFFEHIGFSIVDEWYILSEYIGSLENSTEGKMGDIRGKPTKKDLQKVKENTKRVARML